MTTDTLYINVTSHTAPARPNLLFLIRPGLSTEACTLSHVMQGLIQRCTTKNHKRTLNRAAKTFLWVLHTLVSQMLHTHCHTEDKGDKPTGTSRSAR